MSAVLAAALSSCQSPSPIFLRGCLAVPDRTTCSFAGVDPATASLLPRGNIDAEYAGEYTCTAAVQGIGLSSPIVLFQAEVQVLDPVQNNAVLVQFSVPITAPLQPDAAGDAAALTSVVILDANTLGAVAEKVIQSERVQTVVARFLFRGRLADGTDVTTPFVDYPIDVTMDGTCVDTGGMPCAGPTSVPADCRIGIDEPVGTSCQAIADQLAVCNFLECETDPSNGKSDLATAHCPTHVPPDTSCCNP